MKTMKGFCEVSKTSSFSSDELITYAVVQGDNILQIGSGKGERLKTLMGNKGSHNKAPIIGLCKKIYSSIPIRFFKLNYTSAGTKNSVEERDLQKEFGETNLEGITKYSEAMHFLRSKIDIKENSIEAVLLDLMETHGDVLNHALNTQSTANIVEKMFDGYWKKSSKLT